MTAQKDSAGDGEVRLVGSITRARGRTEMLRELFASSRADRESSRVATDTILIDLDLSEKSDAVAATTGAKTLSEIE